MNLEDYLLDFSEMDTQKLVSDWAALIPVESLTLWMMNRFGDLVLVFEDESVHFLDIGYGTISRIADSREHFCQQIDLSENADSWLMIPFVDECFAAGLILNHGQCYGFKMPPCLNGPYSFDNFVVQNHAEYNSFLADIYNQTKDLPNGTAIRLKFCPS